MSTQTSLLLLYRPLPAYVTNVPLSNDHQRPSESDEHPLLLHVLLTFVFLFNIARKILVLFMLLECVGDRFGHVARWLFEVCLARGVNLTTTVLRTVAPNG